MASSYPRRSTHKRTPSDASDIFPSSKRERTGGQLTMKEKWELANPGVAYMSFAQKRAVRSGQSYAQNVLDGLSLGTHEVRYPRVRMYKDATVRDHPVPLLNYGYPPRNDGLLDSWTPSEGISRRPHQISNAYGDEPYAAYNRFSNYSYRSLDIPPTDYQDSNGSHGRFIDAKPRETLQDISKIMKQSPHTTRSVEISKLSTIHTIHEQQPEHVTAPEITKAKHEQALRDQQISNERKLQTLKSKMEAKRSRADKTVKQTIQANSNRDKVIRELNTAIGQRDSALKKAETASKEAENAAKKNTAPKDQITQLQKDLKASRKLLETSDKRNATLNYRMQVVRDHEAERLLSQEEHWQQKFASMKRDLEEMKDQNEKLAAFNNSQSDRTKTWKREEGSSGEGLWWFKADSEGEGE